MIRQTSRGPREYLSRVEIHIEGSSIFLYVSRETEPWPLKIRNDTSLDLRFQQTSDNGPSEGCIPRDLPAHASVDYSWDAPAASGKGIQLVLDGVPIPKTIDMMAIGSQPPVKVPVSRWMLVGLADVSATTSWKEGHYHLTRYPSRGWLAGPHRFAVCRGDECLQADKARRGRHASFRQHR